MFRFNVLFLIAYAVVFVTATSPTNSYAPGRVACPQNKLTRSALEGISPNEQSYMNQRYQNAKSEMINFLKNANMTGFDIDTFMETSNPTIGLAFSGGGYRAQLAGAGELSALDSRSVQPSVLGGILQSSSYIVGLSGGSWLVGSFVSNDMMTIDQILAQNSLWDLENSLFAYNGLWILSNAAMWANIDIQVKMKMLTGSTVSVTDVYGRALSYQLLSNFNNQGGSFCWSDITTRPSFQKYEMPYPILAALGREPDTSVVNYNSTVFELTPYEVGSWDPSLRSFMNTKYMGSYVDNGVASGKCLNGFDNAGFFMGTSSSLFNAIPLQLDNLNFPTFTKNLINTLAINPYERLNVDIAHYNPNPFYNSKNPNGKIANSKTLYLADGGEDGQNIPLLPLLHRNVSVIFAFDNSADEDGWPDGISMVSTYQRQFSPQGDGIAFPYVPDEYTFRNLNLTSKPTFFGCDAKNLSSLTDNIYDVPLIIYTANRPFTYFSNTSTFKLKYSNTERAGMINNGYNVASRLNGELDDEWAACVGCAIIRREQEKQGIEQTEQCKRCFENYCWDGTIYKGEPLGDNFSEDGLTVSANDFNSNNIGGINDGAIDLI
ncbi:Lysophospholipase 2 [Candida maltosa Xu316]|uniref:Lysophospholipase n=1 Tax=Candida maltosa (strain Xu316) TaxID=1245528 RepID=M3JDK9_CANMX|nr:Lysophospholipase 2 [Candida maltosa Xu316]